DGVARRLAQRGFTLDTAAFQSLETQRKSVQTETQELQARRNQLSKSIGQLKAKKEDASELMAQVTAQADRLKALEQDLEAIQSRMNEFLRVVPNLPHDGVPAGGSAEQNVEARRHGEPRSFDFPVKDHVDVGAALGMDFDGASKLAGSRFVVMRGELAR